MLDFDRSTVLSGPGIRIQLFPASTRNRPYCQLIIPKFFTRYFPSQRIVTGYKDDVLYVVNRIDGNKIYYRVSKTTYIYEDSRLLVHGMTSGTWLTLVRDNVVMLFTNLLYDDVKDLFITGKHKTLVDELPIDWSVIDDMSSM